jgi:plasmid stabilization system protein ParE
MNTEQGFTLHPGAAQDITDIWEFIHRNPEPAVVPISRGY